MGPLLQRKSFEDDVSVMGVRELYDALIAVRGGWRRQRRGAGCWRQLLLGLQETVPFCFRDLLLSRIGVPRFHRSPCGWWLPAQRQP